VRSYVLRAGRMGTGQQRALAELGPRFVLPFQPTPLDLGRCSAAGALRAGDRLRHGRGHGRRSPPRGPTPTSSAWRCTSPAWARCCALIGERGLTNLRIVQHDAVEVLREMVAPASLAGVHVFFPDPWHKKRHHKRRLIQPPLVALLASRLAPGGCCTAPPTGKTMPSRCWRCCRPSRAGNTADGYAPRPDYRPLTKFEPAA
jgi:tRNA (guanine-N7-)-methyltransferase